MFKIINIKEINESFSRQMGNEIITEIANIVKEKMSREYIFVRYMGPKFVIVFSGVEEISTEQFLKDLKEEIEELALIEEDENNTLVEVDGEKEEDEDVVAASPVMNFVVSTYYKGTGIEQLTKRLEEYLDTAPQNESQINFI